MTTVICTYVSEISERLSKRKKLCKPYVASKRKHEVEGAVS